MRLRAKSSDRSGQIGESYNGSITVSKTVHGGSNPSSPVKKNAVSDDTALFLYHLYHFFRSYVPVKFLFCQFGGLIDHFIGYSDLTYIMKQAHHINIFQLLL